MSYFPEKNPNLVAIELTQLKSTPSIAKRRAGKKKANILHMYCACLRKFKEYRTVKARVYLGEVNVEEEGFFGIRDLNAVLFL